MNEPDPQSGEAADALRHPYIVGMRRIIEENRHREFKQLLTVAKESADPAVRSSVKLYLEFERQVVWFGGKKLVDFEQVRRA